MSSRRRSPDGPTLFDLPLGPEERDEDPAAIPEPDAAAAAPPEAGASARLSEAGFSDADLGLRFQAGAADIAFVALVGGGVVLTLALSELNLTLRTLAGVGLFILDFSFIYLLLPLAFWGRTPGMAWAGVRVVAQDGGLPTFRRCALRWVAGVLTVASAGLLGLVALIGSRSLADRISASRLVLADVD